MFQIKKNPISNNKILINCDIIDPNSNYRSKGEIIIEDDKIIDFGPNILLDYEQDKYEIIDCQNNIVCPGLIDLQVHFRDPGQTHKEDLITGSKAAVAGGITSVVCQPNTKPVIDNLDTIEYIKTRLMMKLIAIFIFTQL